MSHGFCDAIVRIDLSTAMIETIHPGADFYRMYLGGGAIGSYFLLKETGPDTDPLSKDNILTIATGIATGAAVSGVSRCSVTALSPLTNMVADSQAGGNIGPMIKRAGFDAIVIKGKAANLSYILIEGDNVSIIDATAISGKNVAEAREILLEKHGSKNISIIQCGTAGEKLVRFANIMADGNDAFGRTGLGAVMGSKNLRAVVVKGDGDVSFADPDSLKELGKSGAKRLPGSGFPETLRKYGTPGVVKFQAEGGNFATHNYSRGSHPEYMKLDGSTYEPQIGAGTTTCYGCVVSCRKRVKASAPYELTDTLGGPEFETLGLLGSNLDITDAAAVAKANEMCNKYGMDTITMGCIAGYLFECLEKGLISQADTDGKKIGFGDPDGLIWLIEAVAQRRGIGDLCAEGFEALIGKFGEKTRPCAVHVKGSGLAVHMPQVKQVKTAVCENNLTILVTPLLDLFG